MSDCYCGKPHTRCAGHNRAGGPCGQQALTGLDKCRNHAGAKLEVAKARGRQAAAMQKARHAAFTYGLPVEQDPHDALLTEVHRTAGHVAWLGHVVADLEQRALTHGVTKTVQKADGARDVTAQAAVNVWVRLYQDERDRLVRVARAAIECGVGERQVRLAEEQGRVIVDVLKATLADLGIEATPEVGETVGRHLRAVEGGKTA